MGYRASCSGNDASIDDELDKWSHIDEDRRGETLGVHEEGCDWFEDEQPIYALDPFHASVVIN